MTKTTAEVEKAVGASTIISNKAVAVAALDEEEDYDLEQKISMDSGEGYLSDTNALSAEDTDSDDQEMIKNVWSFWGLLLTYCHIPLALQMATGVVQILYSLLAGHVIRWVVLSSSSTAWMNHHQQHHYDWCWKWLHSLVAPPAVVGLACLAVVCLIVHPEGATWIVMRQVRYVVGLWNVVCCVLCGFLLLARV